MKKNTPLSNVQFHPYEKQSICWFLVVKKSGLKRACVICDGWNFRKGGPIVVREDRANWMDLLIASPNQKNVVCMHVSDPGLRFCAPTGHGGKKYMCAPGAKCKSHQRHLVYANQKHHPNWTDLPCRGRNSECPTSQRNTLSSIKIRIKKIYWTANLHHDNKIVATAFYMVENNNKKKMVLVSFLGLLYYCRFLYGQERS